MNLGVALSGPVPKCCVNSPDGHTPHPEEGMHVGEDAVPVMCIKLENYQQYVLLKEKKNAIKSGLYSLKNKIVSKTVKDFTRFLKNKKAEWSLFICLIGV